MSLNCTSLPTTDPEHAERQSLRRALCTVPLFDREPDSRPLGLELAFARCLDRVPTAEHGRAAPERQWHPGQSAP